MKKTILGIIIVMGVILVSGCISNDSNNTDEPKTFSANGVFFKYPGQWDIAKSTVDGTIAAVADPASKNNLTGFAGTTVVVEKQNLTMSFNQFYNETYSKLFSNPDYELISEGNLTIGDYNASECVYSINSAEAKQCKAVWIQKDQEVYVILFTTSKGKYESQEKYLNYILSTFKLN
ncbi:PsbP-related protein [Methanobrevibacter filiformis]|uniref:PsbP C-terminal domain-containing protein n=1 Tax=Methanobrevibacter filiformis TaxID=55758 RepID=A0A162FFE8_9EURY|nr:PsbP-related protein [Methanobrevibacter filiformis]KZX12305.1 hypothetical protein MBFIL_11720 [Methanobrevibacter filiformis]